MRNRTFIVAELSANHNQDFELAVKSIEAISKTGVDAVKLQTFKPDSFTMDVNNGYFGPRKNGLWKGMRPIELYTRGAMPYDWQPRLMKIANDLGLVCFSSPFDYEAVDFMEEMGILSYDDLKEEDFTTLSGLAMFLIGRVPKAGDLFSYKNLQFEVVDMDRGRVDKLLVIKKEEEE